MPDISALPAPLICIEVVTAVFVIAGVTWLSAILVLGAPGLLPP